MPAEERERAATPRRPPEKPAPIEPAPMTESTERGPEQPALTAPEPVTILVLLDLRGHGNVLESEVATLRSATEQLVTAAAAAGIQLSGGFIPAAPAETPPPDP